MGRKILRRIFGPVQENCVWRIRTSQELINLYRDPDIVSEIRKGRLIWLGLVERMSEERNMKTLFKNTLEEKGLLRSQERAGLTTLKMVL